MVMVQNAPLTIQIREGLNSHGPSKTRAYNTLDLSKQHGSAASRSQGPAPQSRHWELVHLSMPKESPSSHEDNSRTAPYPHVFKHRGSPCIHQCHGQHQPKTDSFLSLINDSERKHCYISRTCETNWFQAFTNAYNTYHTIIPE